MLLRYYWVTLAAAMLLVLAPEVPSDAQLPLEEVFFVVKHDRFNG
jgi:hypothetical protein